MSNSVHTRSEAATEVIGCVENILGIKREELAESKDIMTDLSADSLDFAELIMEVEDTFGIAIPEEDCEKIHTIGELIDVTYKHWKDT